MFIAASRRMQKAIALLRSFGVKKKPPGYKHLAPLGRSDKQRSAPDSNLNFLAQV